MKELIIHQERIDEQVAQSLISMCPFNAFHWENSSLSITAACKMCRLCVKNGPAGVVTLEETISTPAIDKDHWRGIAVFADTTEGTVHPVTFELLGKARQLAAEIDQPVFALLMGSSCQNVAGSLLEHGADEVFVYDDPRLSSFLIEPYAAVFADFINKVHPTAVLVGATNAGRSLAPRIAARFWTGLTADCTSLEIKQNTDLVQIRPAFGGNIMARIITPNHRPQLCTVRYKIFATPPRQNNPAGKVTPMSLDGISLDSRVDVIHVSPRESGIDLTESEVIMAVGRGIRRKQDLDWLRELAGYLNAPIACTRPLVENGWFDPRLQIGLSGRTVSPKLILAVGISGSVQFVAGMKGSETIIAVNSDPYAAIFNVAHYAAIGDLYDILPKLVTQIAASRSTSVSPSCALGG